MKQAFSVVFIVALLMVFIFRNEIIAIIVDKKKKEYLPPFTTF